MKLEFRLLVVDDNPSSVDEAVLILRDHLQQKGFSLKLVAADDLSPGALKKLAQREGRDYDLVIVDYNLGRSDSNGSDAAAGLRHQLPYTDIIFYSSNGSLDLLSELASRKVAGVFVAYRTEIGDALVGIADTIIAKAIDLNHMRGIAMAEVAEIDLMVGECLQVVFSSDDEGFRKKAKETLDDMLDRSEKGLEAMRPLVSDGRILDLIDDGRIFSSAHKFWALRRAAKCLAENKPTESLDTLSTYEKDVIQRRNTLAHAKENDVDGTTTLKAAQKGEPDIIIDEAWMADFRNSLGRHKAAMATVCDSLTAKALTAAS